LKHPVVPRKETPKVQKSCLYRQTQRHRTYNKGTFSNKNVVCLSAPSPCSNRPYVPCDTRRVNGPLSLHAV